MSEDALLSPASDLVIEVEALKNMLVSRATGGEGDDDQYIHMRGKLIANKATKKVLPRFLVTCRNLTEFWGFIQPKFAHYTQRREFLREEFVPLFLELEQEPFCPAVDDISRTLSRVDYEHVHDAWRKALERKDGDPEGAITAARTLLETVCKHILDEAVVEYNDGEDLPKLYNRAAKQLTLAPSQHTEQVFKQILGGCHAIVEGLGSVRNRLSDSHGKSKKAARPAKRHADLAVNLAGSMAMFLIETHEAMKIRLAISSTAHDIEYIFNSAALKTELSTVKNKLRILEQERIEVFRAEPKLVGAIMQEINLLLVKKADLLRKLKITDLGFDYFDKSGFDATIEACGMVGNWEKLNETEARIPINVVKKYEHVRSEKIFAEFYVGSCFEIPDDDGLPENVLYYLFGSVIAPGSANLFLIDQWST